MKKVTSVILLTAISMAGIFTSCKKTDKPADPSFKCAACTAAPDAMAANNTSSKGIYKGVLIGSTGTIKFDVLNNGTSITALMVIDGVPVNLVSAISWVSGQPYVAPFTGMLAGAAVTINFSVDASGGTPIIISNNIPGHPSAQFSLVKETSLALVEVFEGTYSTTRPETGTFNIMVSRVLGKWGGVSRKSTGTSNGNVNGTIDANLNMIDGGGSKMGVFSGDQLDGKFTDGSANTVTITGKRTL